MSNLLLKQAPPAYVIQPQQSHPRLSLTRVLYVKFLRWVEKASPGTLLRTLAGFVSLAGVCLAYLFPAFMAGMLLDVLQWNGYRIPALVLTVGLCVKGKGLIRWANQVRVKRLGANQHTYHGLPVDELASYLIEQQSFKRDESMKRFAITQPKYNAIAEELKGHQVLIKGDHNAHVLNPAISREQLVRQIREGFPLAFADGQWVERRGSYETFLRDKERSEQKERQRVEKLERRADKAQAKIKMATGFQRVLAMA